MARLYKLDDGDEGLHPRPYMTTAGPASNVLIADGKRAIVSAVLPLIGLIVLGLVISPGAAAA